MQRCVLLGKEFLGTGIVAAHSVSLSPVAKSAVVQAKVHRLGESKKAVRVAKGKAVYARGAELLGRCEDKGVEEYSGVPSAYNPTSWAWGNKRKNRLQLVHI